MARKSKQDVQKAKAAKQKKIAIGGSVLLVLVLAYQVPKTMKMLNTSPKAPVVSTPSGTTTTTTPSATGAPTDPNSLAAPTLAGSPTAAAAPTASSTDLVAAVPMTADPGQLQTFQRFVSKDPFQVQVSSGGPVAGASGGASGGSSGSQGSGAKSGSGSSAPSQAPSGQTPTSPAVPSGQPAATGPSTAVISLNGELMSVPLASDFPVSGATFDRVGAIFHLVSLSAKTAKIAIVGGSYADGAPAITLRLKTPLTLQNTADGMKYTLILEPVGTPVTSSASASSTTPGSTVPTAPVVPSGSGG